VLSPRYPLYSNASPCEELAVLHSPVMPFDVDVAAASLGRARDPSAGAELAAGEESLRVPGAPIWVRDWHMADHLTLSQSSMYSDASTVYEHYHSETDHDHDHVVENGSVDTNGEWMQNLFSAQALIHAPAAVDSFDQGQLGQEARVGQDREDDDDLGWLIPAALRAGIEPGRHQPEHAILSCFRVMNSLNLMQGAQCTEREAGTSLSDPFLSDQRALFPFCVYDSV